ncbi:inositol 2-dehydrogenase [Myxococcota bacterium]|nr:inositol 2-dehydrogenase [Myxococcota bacterium]
MIEVGLFGAGRIGAIHGANVARHGAARLAWVYDVDAAAAERLATSLGTKVATDPGAALADPALDAVIIASPTSTHVELAVLAARAKKAIFCEKPIDLDLGRVDAAIAEVVRAGVPFFVGFNRRFDPSFARVYEAVRRGVIGDVETVTITSRDPAPPPPSYVRGSGGLFRDMMIHDLDMARWMLGEEPVEVFAMASCLVDPAIAEAGDVDTAAVVLKTARGKLAQIQNSRRAAYGYDQRVEVFGQKGMLQAGNVRASTVERWSADGVEADKPLHFFLERYEDAYRAELDHFVRALRDGAPLAITADDGRRALVLAAAAAESLRIGRPVAIGAT